MRTFAQIQNMRSQLEAALQDKEEERGRQAFDSIVIAGPVAREAIWQHGKANGYQALINEVALIMRH